MKIIKVSDSDFEKILDCIRQNYVQYTGNNEIDQDVYEFNSSLDELLSNIKDNTDETEC